MANRIDRINEEARKEISAVIRELKDPRVTSVMLTVVRVEVAHDLSFAKVFISSLGGIEEAKEACKALNGNAKGYIRKEVGLRLSLRKTPDLRFIPDDSIEKGIEMFRALNSQKRKDEEE